jgi:preprotein translocase subunit YajC
MIQTNPLFLAAAWPTLAMQDAPVEGVLGGAQTVDPAAVPGGAGPAAQPASPLSQYFPLIIFGLFGFMMLSMIMNGRKDKKKRAEMLAQIGRKDRVQTIGGVIGTIVEIKGDEFLIESDRASNTRLWVTRASVSTILKSGGDKGEASADKPAETASA